ncbi:ubiquinone biosynthesis accessory factor UbiJ [Luteimonas kalidii]|uniref:Ubiquinone biosynthesis accessory factor UbiJ n=1 Tax=Luteimonas kalidii TaxID=3042025 RepID=A0ABT6JWZ7_9GAMM|nr:SCP2 sterol-binding domain-containing protein [Luteimonas kalidii]MDH5835018.1 SCP2 sterol-binding domain-containing protein [Luteimonas kalidii]
MALFPPSPFDAIKPIAGRALEAALNRAIALDPDTRDALGRLDGRRITLAVQSPPIALSLQVSGDRLVVGPADAGSEPDLAVSATLAGMLGQLPFLRRDDAAPVGRVRVSGDAELARQLQRLAERFDPDWQQPFVSVFGEVVGVQLANAFAGALGQARIVGRNLAQSAAEYVTEESRDVVARAELDAFLDDVDVLREDVDRLAARVARMGARVGTGA